MSILEPVGHAATHPNSRPAVEVVLNRPLNIIAILAAIASFPMIWMGGLVTSHKAGMAVPDWPNSYGYNMFLYPTSEWVGGIFYEHTHRLLGTLVGFLAVLLVLNAWGPGQRPAAKRWLTGLGWGILLVSGLLVGATIVLAGGVELPQSPVATRLSHLSVLLVGMGIILLAAGWARHRDPRPWMRWLCVAALVAIILQGVLGGLRVVMINLNLAVVHGVFAQAVFAGLVGIAVLTGKSWRGRFPGHLPANEKEEMALISWAGIAVAVVFVQLILGAMMRHDDAGLAIPDLPLAFGRVIPPTSQQELSSLGSLATVGQVWLNFSHRVGAIIVAGILIVLIVRVLRRNVGGLLLYAAILLAWLLTLQVTLGTFTVILQKPAELATAHMATGALLLATCTILLIGAWTFRRSRA